MQVKLSGDHGSMLRPSITPAIGDIRLPSGLVKRLSCYTFAVVMEKEKAKSDRLQLPQEEISTWRVPHTSILLVYITMLIPV